MNLDKIDIKALDLLQQDASLSNQALALRLGLSPPSCLRRVKRLRAAGFIEREVAILNADALAPQVGHGLTVLLELSLERQGEHEWQAFERLACALPEVQQCYRVSPGPDFVLVVYARDMPHYLALAQGLLSTDTNVRNVKAFFSVRRAKFDTRINLSPATVLS